MQDKKIGNSEALFNLEVRFERKKGIVKTSRKYKKAEHHAESYGMNAFIAQYMR